MPYFESPDTQLYEKYSTLMLSPNLNDKEYIYLDIYLFRYLRYLHLLNINTHIGHFLYNI